MIDIDRRPGESWGQQHQRVLTSVMNADESDLKELLTDQKNCDTLTSLIAIPGYEVKRYE